ncbi:MAG: glycosyltransferase family A protein [Anaerolineales bacterium]
MREGQNPAKFVESVAKPQRVTVAVLSYIPFLSGYFAQSLQVLKKSLQSIRDTADEPFDLMVFDNGSGPETIQFLEEQRDAGNIQMLVLSDRNLGKGGAWNIIFSAAPGEIIAYSDSDALFYPGWLSKSIALLEGFPRVGMVTARPFRTAPELYSATVDWAEQAGDANLERGQFVSWQDFLDFDRSLGQSEEEIRDRYDSTEDVRILRNGISAIVGASHFQFVTHKSVAGEFLPFDMDRPMGQVIEFDRRLNDAGYLRLMTEEPMVMNMSNTPIVTDQERQEAGTATSSGIKKWVLGLRPIRWGLLAVHNRIFRWYYTQ